MFFSTPLHTHERCFCRGSIFLSIPLYTHQPFVLWGGCVGFGGFCYDLESDEESWAEFVKGLVRTLKQ